MRYQSGQMNVDVVSTLISLACVQQKNDNSSRRGRQTMMTTRKNETSNEPEIEIRDARRVVAAIETTIVHMLE